MEFAVPIIGLVRPLAETAGNILQLLAFTKLSKDEKKNFFSELPVLLERQCQLGNLESRPSPAESAPGRGGKRYIMTERGAHMILTIYDDIAVAAYEYNVIESVGLQNKVTVYASPDGIQGKLRDRIGQRWPSHMRERILRSKDTYPFLRAISRLQRPALAMGLIRKATRSRSFTDLLIPRFLGLAQLCGIEYITGMDLLELVADAPFYEKLIRIYISFIIGNIDKTTISNAAFGNIFAGHRIGSTQYIHSNFSNLAPKMPGTIVQVGTIRDGKAHLEYPQPLESCTRVTFHISSGVDQKEGEPIYMLSGWAACLALRPPQVAAQTKTQPLNCLYYDVHGSPLYAVSKPEEFHVTIKRVSDGRLFGKPAAFGWVRPPRVTGQGIYGRRCGCTTMNPDRRVHAGGPAKFNGVPLRSLLGSGEKLTWDDIRMEWHAGDLPMQLHYKDAFPYSTYVQVPGECLYCALDRALGTGCWIMIAGGLPLPPGS